MDRRRRRRLPRTPHLPNEILIKIFSQFAFVDIAAEHSFTSHRDPSHPLFAQCYDGSARRVFEEPSRSHLATKHSLSLVSKLYNSLTKDILYAHVRIKSANQLRVFNESLERSEEFRNTVAQYTRRMDIVLIEEPEKRVRQTSYQRSWILNYPVRSRRPISDYEIAGSVLRSCTCLAHLTVAVSHLLIEDDSHPFCDIVAEACPSLQVLNWRFAPRIKATRSFTDFIARIQVLDVSCVSPFHSPFKLDVEELPYLHTLKGAINFFLPALEGVRLPSLRTLIMELGKEVDFDDVSLLPPLRTFLERHGQQLEAFSCYSDSIPITLKSMPNLRELILPLSEETYSIFKGYTPPMSSLSYIGILGIYQREWDSISPKSARHSILSFYPSYEFGTFLHICELLLDRSGFKGCSLPRLKLVQICSKGLSFDATRMEGRLRGDCIPISKLQDNGIRFTDCNGDDIKLDSHLEATLRSHRICRTNPRAIVYFDRYDKRTSEVENWIQMPFKTPRKKLASPALFTHPPAVESLSCQFDFAMKLEDIKDQCTSSSNSTREGDSTEYNTGQ